MSDRPALPDPASPRAPEYWRYEVTGCLERPIMRYLESKPLSDDDVMLIRAYLQQWIDSPVWDANPNMDSDERIDLAALRQAARFLRNPGHITEWLERALDIGIDPL